VTAFKKAEDGKGFVARGYALEAARWPALFAAEAWAARTVGLTEDKAEEPGPKMRPFEIRTVRIQERESRNAETGKSLVN
jgi:hypothetical protein